MTRPQSTEADQYYFRYIDLVADDEIVPSLETQLGETMKFLKGISEEQSLHSYAPEKWTIRQIINHVNDAERIFLSRALWFARGFQEPLPSFDQEICVEAAQANETPWCQLVEEFRTIRLGTISLFGNLPEMSWSRTGVASGYSFTVRALAYIIAGHVAHHNSVIRERYL